MWAMLLVFVDFYFHQRVEGRKVAKNKKKVLQDWLLAFLQVSRAYRKRKKKIENAQKFVKLFKAFIRTYFFIQKKIFFLFFNHLSKIS